MNLTYQKGQGTALRTLGPKVFVSYSFGDRELATALGAYLCKQGFQVRLEDGGSLVGRRLTEELSRRISDAECFVQLLTHSAGQSSWVKEEFAYAERSARAGRPLIVIPVVVESGGATWLGDFAYIDATRHGLSPTVLESIKTVALSSLRLLCVEEDNPLRLSECNLGQLVGETQIKKRVLFDSSAYWIRAIDRLIAWGEGEASAASGAQQFVQQCQQRRRTVEGLLDAIDIVLHPFLECMSRYIADGVLEEHHFQIAIGIFQRVVVAKYFFDDLLMLENTGSAAEALRAEMGALREIARDAAEEPIGLGSFLFESKLSKAKRLALSRVLSETDLLPYVPERSPATEVRMVLGRQKRRPGALTRIELVIPQMAVPFVVGTEVLPHPTAKRWVWALFCLPQVAVRAIEVAGLHRSASRDAVVHAVQQDVGWELADYDSASPGQRVSP